MGVPPVIIHIRLGLSLIKHPFLDTSICGSPYPETGDVTVPGKMMEPSSTARVEEVFFDQRNGPPSTECENVRSSNIWWGFDGSI